MTEAAHIVDRGKYQTLDVLGPTIEFLTDPQDPAAVYCAMLGVIPPGVAVPLHSHADIESFYVLSGSVRMLSDRGGRFEWLEAKAGNFIHVPSGVKHAFRNASRDRVVELLITTPKLGRFFQEVGRPVTPGSPLPPPTAENIAHFLEVAARYGYWNASPAENAAIGISLG
jgi:quercetin dioxygenase-like cupin family protein